MSFFAYNFAFERIKKFQEKSIINSVNFADGHGYLTMENQVKMIEIKHYKKNGNSLANAKAGAILISSIILVKNAFPGSVCMRFY